MWTESSTITAYKKKLYKLKPNRKPCDVETFRTTKKTRIEQADAGRLEREVRQLLANKISGNMVGLWLLIPEHLRLGTWDLLRSWCCQPADSVYPRLALQLVHEAALCSSGIRDARHFSQRGFELTNGLPFVASDTAIHDLLDAHTVAEAESLQVALGIVRRARGHFKGQLIAIDPFCKRSYTKRQTTRYRRDETTKPFKTASSYFALDADTSQPIGFIHNVSSLPLIRSCPKLLSLCSDILNPDPGQVLVLADTQHYTSELMDYVHQKTVLDLLVPMRHTRYTLEFFRNVPHQDFTRRWAGYATTKQTYKIKNSLTGPHHLYLQRSGEKPENYEFKGFLGSRDADECETLVDDFPKRWHIEEFFNVSQDLGWRRAGTRNINIRYAHMTMGLLAQAACHELRMKLGEPYESWDAKHFAKTIFQGLEGDIRVSGDTIIVTLYNAEELEHARTHYENLPEKLQADGIDPRIPWLYNFKLDFRFK
ncbi:MAG: hypothetical protein O3B01_26320 [Planctomycetota bacterium]|nr:hypothetical protein [Planctomycetota bacterium]